MTPTVAPTAVVPQPALPPPVEPNTVDVPTTTDDDDLTEFLDPKPPITPPSSTEDPSSPESGEPDAGDTDSTTTPSTRPPLRPLDGGADSDHDGGTTPQNQNPGA
ncbi:MAG: hypothetical protein QM774_02270 [Gordonia sp. (in: high G+C Gram-positive bacteria)]|uniref:hypothetical protein n=1 Tax=Gordonia sp. (in: high G+C Gram-positive bacteria) TaxID=84139 RepID=UPI0039E6D19D